MTYDDAAIEMTDNASVNDVARELLVGTNLASVHFVAGFSAEFVREAISPQSLVPSVVRLTMRADWGIGDRRGWNNVAQSARSVFPKATDDAIRGFALMTLLGSNVVRAAIGDDGALTIHTDAAEIWIEGHESDFEESWILDVPPDLPNARDWSLVCTNSGRVYGRRPPR
jgi:hypothetical protein